MKELVSLSVFIVLSTLFAIAMILAGFICQYKQGSAIKNTIYECGMKPATENRIMFDIRFFNYAVMFLVFDVETIFLYPFAVFVNALGVFAIIEAFIFITILLIGLFLAIKKKMLRWT